MYTLHGDGIHDDTAAIQAMIDGGACEVCLPPPKKFYLISKPLELPSNFRLVLPRFAEIRLASGANCVMLRNKLVRAPAPRLKPLSENHGWSFVDDFSPDTPCRNIEVCGGIWNCNNMGQNPNPQQSEYTVREFYGFGMLFYNVKNLKLASLTVKDPSNYGIALDTVSYFTVDDITFDYNKGNPLPINMDGIHLNGNCHFGVMSNLKGACYDDLVALNADEGSEGPITNIEIDGIFAENCHSAARLLAVKYRIENVRISNVYGTYYQYCIGLTKYYKGEVTGGFYAITLNGIYASKAVRTADVYPWPSSKVFSIIWIDTECFVKTLTVRDMYRNERNNPIPTVMTENKSFLEHLVLDGITVENHTGEPMPFLFNQGTIKFLHANGISIGNEELTVNCGTIEKQIVGYRV